jgi:GrpB-like predicted nucleotidyltransferase (UPF0157 family)
MAPIVLKSADDLIPQVELVVTRLSAQLGALLPGYAVHHIGATAIAGALTKGDVDVLLQVPAAEFPTAVRVLRENFPVRQAQNWTSEFASFGNDAAYELPVGIQVVVVGSELDFLPFLRDYFRANPDALREYNQLKLEHALEGPDGYWKAKDRYLATVLAIRRTLMGKEPA